MIRSILWLGAVNLLRDRIALGLTFLMPIAFFSLFAFVLGGISGESGGKPKIKPVKVLAVDQDQSDQSKKLLKAVSGHKELDLITEKPAANGEQKGQAYSRDEAAKEVRQGNFAAAIVIPQGFGEHFPDFQGTGPPLELIYDGANPMAQPTVAGLLQGSAFTAMPDLMMEQGFQRLQRAGWSLTPEQTKVLGKLKKALRGEIDWSELADDSKTPKSPPDASGPETQGEGKPGDKEAKEAAKSASFQPTGLLRVVSREAREATATQPAESSNDEKLAPGSVPKKRSSMISYYAAGIGVMFLLFSMAGASSSLLEEEESGTLDRVLTCAGSINSLIFGRWMFFAVLGFAQVVLMFVWGWLFFGLELWTRHHFIGFVLVSIVTAAAASGFGIMLAAMCRTRAQLNGVSTIVILIMSAAGGSMMPRFIMPDIMKSASRFTFNGWALDGYLKVFWYDDPGASLWQSVASLAPQLAMLLALTAVFLLIARRFAKRWEAV